MKFYIKIEDWRWHFDFYSTTIASCIQTKRFQLDRDLMQFLVDHKDKIKLMILTSYSTPFIIKDEDGKVMKKIECLIDEGSNELYFCDGTRSPLFYFEIDIFSIEVSVLFRLSFSQYCLNIG